MPRAGPHKRVTLASNSGLSPEESCFALPEPAQPLASGALAAGRDSSIRIRHAAGRSPQEWAPQPPLRTRPGGELLCTPLFQLPLALPQVCKCPEACGHGNSATDPPPPRACSVLSPYTPRGTALRACALQPAMPPNYRRSVATPPIMPQRTRSGPGDVIARRQAGRSVRLRNERNRSFRSERGRRPSEPGKNVVHSGRTDRPAWRRPITSPRPPAFRPAPRAARLQQLGTQIQICVLACTLVPSHSLLNISSEPILLSAFLVHQAARWSQRPVQLVSYLN